ncbi:Cytochrome b5-like heme/steroid binding domain [Pseudocohnilembus persalinus]|uniref:Cytochrome b5-like heme/steroid binding domain n=1 Tax=Pseudocohnilembus persalinus TaxID=266149 RepID=A0A0V0QTF6_PSEPJ|nr:Cytochrome b5-like heme/steroid binding domain [Pseudocohnilembus persalinus]|eukprot:KRX05463.1 Cytochrome b5-like heme/steroid binding domain [Pseudocohnilembus persalinus]
MAENKQLKEITWEEVSKHNTSEDCWIVVDGLVYQVQDYLDDHPGGPIVISSRGGKDVSKPFRDAGHSDEAIKKLKTLQIGYIKEGTEPLPGQVEGDGNNSAAIGAVAFGVIILIIFYVFFLSGNGAEEQSL